MDFSKYLHLAFILTIPLSGLAQNVMVLGVTQDGGFPHIGCQQQCLLAYQKPEMKRMVVSLAIMDRANNQWYLMEATPDLRDQLQYFRELTGGAYPYLPEAIFLTHAHMGHYTGLIHLGREALGAQDLKVYCLPRLKTYLASNGPWSQLVDLRNIRLMEMSQDAPLSLGTVTITAMVVPHRDEYSETAGFSILAGSKRYLFIPDIDKWERWEQNITEEVTKVDIAFLDGSFYADGELPNRPMSEIPHPFVTETIGLFGREPESVRQKVHLIHFNHTNPLLWDEKTRQKLKKTGLNIAIQGAVY